MTPPEPPTLMSAPNVSEGRDRALDRGARRARFAGEGVRLLDVHSDADHHRSVFTLAGPPPALADALLGGRARGASRASTSSHRAADGPALAGQHPHVGAARRRADRLPRRSASRGAACAEALVVADRIGDELAVPVFLYGELTRARTDEHASARARSCAAAGVQGLSPADAWSRRCRPDFGPPRLHPTAGATLVAARPPLVAFNLQLAAARRARPTRARSPRASARAASRGFPGCARSLSSSTGGVAQVSMNVEQPSQLPLAAVVDAVARLAPVRSAELVGLAPAAALEGFPAEVPMPGFDPRATSSRTHVVS